MHKLFFCPKCRNGWQKDIAQTKGYGMHNNKIQKYVDIPSYGLDKIECVDCKKKPHAKP